MKRDILKINKNFKTKNIVFWIFIILTISSIPLTQGIVEENEKQITLTYSFKYPTVQTININGEAYSRIFLADCFTASNAGEPNIPSKAVYILIPPNSKIENIQITTDKEYIFGEKFNIDPVGESIPITYSSISQKIFKNIKC